MRADDLRVERAAVAATEPSLARCAELYLAVPAVDHGADLFPYHAGLGAPGGKGLCHIRQTVCIPRKRPGLLARTRLRWTGER